MSFGFLDARFVLAALLIGKTFLGYTMVHGIQLLEELWFKDCGSWLDCASMNVVLCCILVQGMSVLGCTMVQGMWYFAALWLMKCVSCLHSGRVNWFCTKYLECGFWLHYGTGYLVVGHTMVHGVLLLAALGTENTVDVFTLIQGIRSLASLWCREYGNKLSKN